MKYIWQEWLFIFHLLVYRQYFTVISIIMGKSSIIIIIIIIL